MHEQILQRFREYYMNYDKQDQQGKAAFNERNPHTTQQQMGKEPRRTPNKNRTGHKAEHGQVNH
jgi:hypothetical protein